MNGFSAGWLHLREPLDQAAREAASAALDLSSWFAQWRKRSPQATLEVIDLACGHGANFRALAPQLGGLQRWRLVDHDAALLDAAPGVLEQWARGHNYRVELEGGAGAEGDERAIEIAGPDFHACILFARVDLARDLAGVDFGETLITASALLDLVSESWLQGLIHKAQAAGAALALSLTVDGRIAWEPPDSEDALVHELFSRHQRRDKGFGPAMGSGAGSVAMKQLAHAGYETVQVQTDWIVDGTLVPGMQRAMVEGMAAAALEQDPGARDAVLSWRARRGAAIGKARLRVGHVDIVARPA